MTLSPSQIEEIAKSPDRLSIEDVMAQLHATRDQVHRWRTTGSRGHVLPFILLGQKCFTLQKYVDQFVVGQSRRTGIPH